MDYLRKYDRMLDLAYSDSEFTVLASRSRINNVRENLLRFGIVFDEILEFESLTREQISGYLQSTPCILSVSGQTTLAEYLPLLRDSNSLVSEFLCWSYISSFTPLDFYPPSNWSEALKLFEANTTSDLLASGFAEALRTLREYVTESSVEALFAFETVLELYFRLRIPLKSTSYYTTSSIFPKPGDTVLDCGACASSFGGQFTTLFADLVAPNGKVIAFEPIPEVFTALRRDTKDFFNVILVNAAVWNRRTTLSFVSDGISSRHITHSSLVQASPSDQVSVIAETIDEIADTQRVNFIKMDVEGSEYEALLGAERTIRRDLPNLSICLYHSPEDFIRLPELIKSFDSRYRLFLELNEGHSWAGLKMFATVSQ